MPIATIRSLFPVILAVSLTPAAMRASVIGNFNSSSEGWTSGGVCSFNPNVGDPAGDLDCGTQVTGPTLTAPAKFLGNDSAAFGNTFSFDMFNRLSNVFVTLDLIGDGQGLMYVIGDVGPSSSWEQETVPLTPSAWTALNSAAKPSAAGFESILKDVTAIQVVTSIPTFTDLAFDNFNLGGVTATPEPGTISLFAFAGALIAIGRKGRRKGRGRADSAESAVP